MSTATPFGRAARLADAVKRRGAPIVLRRLTRTPGPVPLLNPPRVTNAAIAGAVIQGATVVALKADYAMGQLLPGDALSVAGVTLQVTGVASAKPANAVPPGFAAVPIAPAPVAIADGSLVALAFAADLATYAIVDSFPVRLIDGERIRARDLSIEMAAYGLPDELEPTWSIIFQGRELSIVQATPHYDQGQTMNWSIQARS